ncbi:MAG: hypothetical protein ACRENP_24090 [Longimicrobiales bacterium]
MKDLAIRSGEITGRLQGDELRLDWALPPARIPYRTLRLYPTKQETIKATTGPAYSPWNAVARVTLEHGGWQAVLPRVRQTAKEDATTRPSDWFAYYAGLAQR